MPRALLLVFGLLVFASAALLAAGCLDSMPAAPRPDSGVAGPKPGLGALHVPSLDSVGGAPDAGSETTADLMPPPPPDLRPSDLTGLTNCYDRAYCDVSTMFCLRFFGGSPGKPEPEKVAPSCYTPNDPCPNGTLDCNCIQEDAVLGPSCAECFDNKDGTFTCYAQ